MEAMPNHERACRTLLLRQRQELRCETTYDVAIECHKVRTQKP